MEINPQRGTIRRCAPGEQSAILEIITAAAVAYRGAVPAELLHEPYMTAAELDNEIAAGVEFWGYDVDRALVGVMGIQGLRDVDLIRHAYVHPSAQGRGVGHALMKRLEGTSGRQMLVGTWAAATWAIRFYERHGFELVRPACAATLMAKHWGIPSGQTAASVVLANPPLGEQGPLPPEVTGEVGQ